MPAVPVMRSTLLATLVVAVTSLLAAPAALAHTHAVGTAPAGDETVDRPPDRAGVWFDGPVEPAGSGLEVVDRTGTRVDLGDVSHGDASSELTVGLPSDLPAGTYLARWSVVSADSHVHEGEWVFTVTADAPAATVTADEGTAPDDTAAPHDAAAARDAAHAHDETAGTAAADDQAVNASTPVISGSGLQLALAAGLLASAASLAALRARGRRPEATEIRS